MKKRFDLSHKFFLENELDAINALWARSEIFTIKSKRASFIQQLLLIIEGDKTVVWIHADFTDVFTDWLQEIYADCQKNGASYTNKLRLSRVAEIKNLTKI